MAGTSKAEQMEEIRNNCVLTGFFFNVFFETYETRHSVARF